MKTAARLARPESFEPLPDLAGATRAAPPTLAPALGAPAYLRMDDMKAATLDRGGLLDQQLDKTLQGDLTAPGAPPGARKGPLDATLEGEVPAEAAPEAPPVAETGAVLLDAPPLDLPPIGASFDAPAALGVRPDVQPDAAAAKNPDVANYASVFAAASASAARLHRALVGDAERAADDARRAASERADRLRAGVDADLARLAEGLASARAALGAGAADASRHVAMTAEQARGDITKAAKSAQGMLGAAAARMRGDLAGPKATAKTVEASARKDVEGLASNVEKSSANIVGLGDNAADNFATGGGAMEEAQVEGVVTGMQPRAVRRAAMLREEATRQATFLKPPLDGMPGAIAGAANAFDTMIDHAAKAGPAAVAKARDAALKQVDATAAQLDAAIEGARAASEALLIRQHNDARAQNRATAEARLKGEVAGASARGGRDVAQALSAARGPGGAVASLARNLEEQRHRPPAEFAQAVVRGANGLAARLAASIGEQRPRLADAAARGRDALDRQSADTSMVMAASAEAMAATLTRLAASSAEPLLRQAEGGAKAFAKVAQPIAKTMQSYLTPFDDAYLDKKDDMVDALADAAAQFTAVFATGSSPPPRPPRARRKPSKTPKPEVKTPSPPPPKGKAPEGPRQIPKEFATGAATGIADPKLDTLIAEFIAKAREKVRVDIGRRTRTLDNQLAASGDVDPIMEALRGLTPKGGAAVDAQSRFHGRIEDLLREKLPKILSTGGTDDANVNAAIAHLHGDEAAAAIEELKAAVNWSNDDKRIEAVQKSLTPASIARLHALGRDAELDAIAADLDGVDREIFELRRNGSPDSVAAANALAVKRDLDKAGQARGNDRRDKTLAAVELAATSAGTDALSGADDTGDTLGRELQRERAEKAWSATLAKFDEKVDPLKGGAKPAIEGRGAGLYAYATRSITHYDSYGEGDVQVSEESMDKKQAFSLEKLLVNGAQSDEYKAAKLVDLLGPDPGKADPKKIDALMHDKSTDAQEGVRLTDKEKTERDADAQARLLNVLKLYGQYAEPDRKPALTGDDVRKELVGKIEAGMKDDPEKLAFAKGALTDPKGDPVAAANFAIEGVGTDVELLKTILRRMDREQVDAFMKKYNETHEQPLRTRLGVSGEGDWSLGAIVTGNFPETSGDDRNDLEIALLGVPTTDRERAEVARLTVKQQIDQVGVLGPLVAHEEYQNLLDSSERLRDGMGLTAEQYAASFDKYGRFIMPSPVDGAAKPFGNFNAAGDFQPPAKGALSAFDYAVGIAQLDAQSYKDATDRVANYVTTALVVAAAVVTTIATAGAAASIWIPVMVTAGAGLLGMGASYLIKGGRYGHEEIAKDLAMTIVQAATAGLGAAAGAAMKGGMPALKIAAGSLKVTKAMIAAEAATANVARGLATAAAISEEAAATAAARSAAMTSLTKGLSFGEEVAIGAGSGAFAGGANAALDGQAWRDGKYGTNILHGIARGGIGGGVGSAASQLGSSGVNRLAAGGRLRLGLPALAEGERAHWALGGLARVAGSGGAGFSQSVTEGAYGAIAQDKDVKLSELATTGGWAALQNVVQTIGEHGADEHHEAGQKKASGGGGAPPAQERPGQPVRDAAATNESAAPSRATTPPEPADRAHPAVAVAGPETVPARPHAEGEAPARTAPRSDDEPPGPAPARRTPEPEGEGSPRGRAASTTDPEESARGATAPTAEEPAPVRASGHPDHSGDPVEHLDVFPEHTVITDLHPHDVDRAMANYHELITDQPGMEVAVAYNHITREYAVIQGNPGQVGRELLEGAGWTIEAHYHPLRGESRTTPMWMRMPSGKGGDFHMVEWDAHAQGGGPRKSVIHYIVDGAYMTTTFGFDPHSTSERYWLELETAPGQPPERHGFPDLDAYGRFYKGRFNGTPHAGAFEHEPIVMGALPPMNPPPRRGEPAPAGTRLELPPANDAPLPSFPFEHDEPGAPPRPASAPRPPEAGPLPSFPHEEALPEKTVSAAPGEDKPAPRTYPASGPATEKDTRPRMFEEHEIDAMLDAAFPTDPNGPKTPPFTTPPHDPIETPGSRARAALRAEWDGLFGKYPVVMDDHLRKLDFATIDIDAAVDNFAARAKAEHKTDPAAADAAIKAHRVELETRRRNDLDAAVDAFAKARRADGKADKATADADIARARARLERQQERVLEEFTLRKQLEVADRAAGRQSRLDRLSGSEKVKALVRESPALFGMANWNPEIAQKRLQRFAGRFKGGNFTSERWNEAWQAYYISNQLVGTSEHDALFRLGRAHRDALMPADEGIPLDVLKGGGRGNKHGIDAIAVERPPPNAPLPEFAETHLIDDKALMADSVASVTALTQYLQGNLERDAAGIKAQLKANEALGIPPDPLHQKAAKQISDAAAAIGLLKKQPQFAGADKVWQDKAYAGAVRKIMSDHHLHLSITSARGYVTKVSDLLGEDGYGFRMLFDKP